MKAAILALGALLACALAVPQAAWPRTVPAAQATPVKHIVLLDLENHSFDNVLGFWCDDHPGRCPDGGMPSRVTLSDGTVVTPTRAPDIVPLVNHSVAAQQAAINGGAMNGWQNMPSPGCGPSVNYDCITGYEPSQIPNLAGLATNFAVSDHTFSMADSPSWGGHLYVAMASLDGFTGNNPVKDNQAGAPAPGHGWGCDSNKVTEWINPQGRKIFNVPSCVPDPTLPLANGGAFKPTPVHYAPTIFDRLDAAGRSWKIYGTPKQHAGAGGAYAWSICPSMAECLYTSEDQNLVNSSQFVTDAAAGKLPAYSVLVPGFGTSQYSEHNHLSMTAGDNWVGRVASAVMNGPEWRSTVLFITYDDCGCFFDQVRPGVNPDGTPQGPRLPLVIVSPYARPGYTDKTATTFAGILAYVERTFGLPPLSVNDARAYPFTNAFNYSQAPLRPVPMVTRPLPPGSRHIHLTPAELNDPT